MDKAFHPTEEELHLYLDHELAGEDLRRVEAHLRRCAECMKQLEEWGAGAALYGAYHAAVLQPSLVVETPDWTAVRSRAAGPVPNRQRSWWWLAGTMAAAAAALLIVAAYQRGEQRKAAEATALIAKAESSRQTDAQVLRFEMGAQSWVRQTGRTSDGEAGQQARSLFVQARYDWNRPLSVRSFATWRRGLESKHDDVLLIRNAHGEKYAYRLRTQTPRGSLRTVSLMLRSDTYHPTAASFQFEGQDRLDVSEAPEPPRGEEPRKETARGSQLHAEHVGPDEELRVMAALNRVGADVEDAVSVRLDERAGHVLVNGLGLTSERQRVISAALANEPAAAIRFETGSAAGRAVRARGVEPSKTATGDYRRRLDEAHKPPGAAPNKRGTAADLAAPGESVVRSSSNEAGGAQKWQAMSDTALTGTANILAHAHALLRLQQEFGPRVEAQLSAASRQTLLDLVTKHAQAVLAATGGVKDTLKSVMLAVEVGGNPVGRTWQDRARHLYEQARLLDEDANRFLIDDYDEAAARQLKSAIALRLERVEKLAREEAPERR